jgi:amino acid adenylation domain-containing protein
VNEIPREWNGESTPYPREQTVAQVFEEIAATFPENVALEFENQKISYQELNAKANRLAHALREKGVGSETLVGCCMERSPDLIVAFLGVLKAGGAYVPLDASYPKERFDFLITDTKTPFILTQKSLASALCAHDLPLLHLDELLSSTKSSGALNPLSIGSATDLAYVMYTSGSTGTPRGALIEQRSIVRLVRNTNFAHFGQEEVFLQFAPVSFDASTLEIWGPLLNGGRLAIMPARASSLDDLGRAIRKHGVTTLWLTAGLFNLMIDERIDDLKPLRQLIAGGDALSARHVQKALDHLSNCTLINGYGPTENTTFTCCHTMHPGELVPTSIPIGKPISNTSVYILDEQMVPVGPGETGELFASGDGVARGYLNKPEETAKKFLRDAFAPDADARMYRTGDLARWREDGVIEFLGRVDNQVKILGHRIEPGEIEAVLQSRADIKQVCVVPRFDGDGPKRLVAYYIPAQAPLQAGEIRKFLAGKLPPQLIPSAFVALTTFPLSPNGKVDRAALPAPVFTAENEISTKQAYGELEQKIAGIWKRILRIDQAGLNDNFFDLGGDSLLLIAVHSNLQKVLETEFPVTDLFEFTTIGTLAKHLGEKNQNVPAFSEARNQAQRQREAFAQQRQRRSGGDA